MSVISLILGMALCWAAGGSLLLALKRGGALGSIPTVAILGYGYFVGILLVCLFLVTSDALTGRFSYGLVLAGLAAVLVAGLWLARRSSMPSTSEPPAAGDAAPWLTFVLAALVLAHALFSLVELLAQPLLPWDAWTVWVYRAKVWFFEQRMVEFIPARDWYLTTDVGRYSHPALDYPPVASLIPLWAALALGRWHEALINLPVIFCAAAIALALYGHARAAGLGRAMSLLGVYVLVSTPLFATHMSLGGYADIWMAGFAGLGFVALIHGLCLRQPGPVTLGLLLLAAGTVVKFEGLVWLASGLLLWTLVRLPGRVLVVGVVLVAAVGVLSTITGVTQFHLPLLGDVGVVSGTLVLPGIGAVGLQVNDVLHAYLHNLFLMGNWNVAWILILLAALAAALRPVARSAPVALVFLLILAATQALIFGFSIHGAWAEDYTAVNRLPLHVYPAAVFCLLLLSKGWWTAGQDRVVTPPARAPRLAPAVVGALSLLLVFGGLSLWLRHSNPGASAEAVRVEAEAMTFVFGAGGVSAGRVHVRSFQDGAALLSSGPLDIDAERLTLLELDLRFEPVPDAPERSPAFFWRLAAEPERVHRVTLRGEALVDLSSQPQWRGRVSEVGFLLMRNADHPASVGGIEFRGAGVGSLLRLLPGEWFRFEPWSQRSLNALDGGTRQQRVALPALVIAWLLVAGTVLALICRGMPPFRAVVAFALVAWFVLDARWLLNRTTQFRQSFAALTTLDIEQRIARTEMGYYHDLVARVRDELTGPEPSRILILLDPAEPDFYGLRSKYELLPDNSGVMRTFPSTRRLGRLDFVLFLGNFLPDDRGPLQNLSRDERLAALPIPQAARRRLRLVELSERGALFAVRREEG